MTMKIKNRIASKVTPRGQRPTSPRKASGPPRHAQARAGIAGGNSQNSLANHLATHRGTMEDDRDDISIGATVHTLGSLATDYNSVWTC